MKRGGRPCPVLVDSHGMSCASDLVGASMIRLKSSIARMARDLTLKHKNAPKIEVNYIQIQHKEDFIFTVSVQYEGQAIDTMQLRMSGCVPPTTCKTRYLEYMTLLFEGYLLPNVFNFIIEPDVRKRYKIVQDFNKNMPKKFNMAYGLFGNVT